MRSNRAADLEKDEKTIKGHNKKAKYLTVLSIGMGIVMWILAIASFIIIICYVRIEIQGDMSATLDEKFEANEWPSTYEDNNWRYNMDNTEEQESSDTDEWPSNQGNVKPMQQSEWQDQTMGDETTTDTISDTTPSYDDYANEYGSGTAPSYNGYENEYTSDTPPSYDDYDGDEQPKESEEQYISGYYDERSYNNTSGGTQYPSDDTEDPSNWPTPTDSTSDYYDEGPAFKLTTEEILPEYYDDDNIGGNPDNVNLIYPKYDEEEQVDLNATTDEQYPQYYDKDYNDLPTAQNPDTEHDYVDLLGLPTTVKLVHADYYEDHTYTPETETAYPLSNGKEQGLFPNTDKTEPLVHNDYETDATERPVYYEYDYKDNAWKSHSAEESGSEGETDSAEPLTPYYDNGSILTSSDHDNSPANETNDKDNVTRKEEPNFAQYDEHTMNKTNGNDNHEMDTVTRPTSKTLGKEGALWRKLGYKK